jgi:hypothetical protein
VDLKEIMISGPFISLSREIEHNYFIFFDERFVAVQAYFTKFKFMIYINFFA